MRCNVCAAPLVVAGYVHHKKPSGFICRSSPRYAPCRNIGDATKHFRPTIAHGGSALTELPSAREVRDVFGHITIDGYRVSHCDNWGDARFPWRVQGPLFSANDPDLPEARKEIETFPRYSEAVACARKEARKDWTLARVRA